MAAMVRRGDGLTPGEVAIGCEPRRDVPRYVAYGLPHGPESASVWTQEGFDLYELPLGSTQSFLDYDAVVLFAGAFETVDRSGWYNEPRMRCAAPQDLDLREREFYTGIGRNLTVVFLVPRLPETVGHRAVNPQCDLFRRVLKGKRIRWSRLEAAEPHISQIVPEFKDFVERFGSAYVRFFLDQGRPEFARVICRINAKVLGFELATKAFFVPCVQPQTHEQAVEMAAQAVRAAIAYRERMKRAYPKWIARFRFTQEAALREQADDLRRQLTEVEAGIDRYADFKGLLCLRSDPLVETVQRLLVEFFDIKIESEDERIEDATLKDDDGNILAVFEIKGINGNFRRQDVNQVDSHRERLELTSETPGILIMNTCMTVQSLTEKDRPPHPDIISKSVADNVLLMRTLDLLKYADYVEAGKLEKESLRAMLLSEAGWLKVENDRAELVK